MPTVRALVLDDLPAYLAHMIRADADSGVGAPRFHPYEADETLELATALPREQRRWQTPLDAPGWRRAWGCFSEAGVLVGHAYLAGGGLRSERHRASLGMALEPGHRRQGGGRALLQAAVDWARDRPELAWIDLGVFSENAAAQALYARFGFVVTGRVADRFRVDGHRIDDIQMALAVG